MSLDTEITRNIWRCKETFRLVIILSVLSLAKTNNPVINGFDLTKTILIMSILWWSMIQESAAPSYHSYKRKVN
jgi:hypothetical protein